MKKNENKALRDKLARTYPKIEPFLEDLWPKDANVEISVEAKVF
ncbi:MAG: Tma20 N-terminal domain-containing protein [bacterium]